MAVRCSYKSNYATSAALLPRLCLWETGPQRCAALPPPTINGNDWTTYKWSGTLDSATKAVDLTYADSNGDNTVTINDYADVRVMELPLLPSLVFLGTPVTGGDSSALVVQHAAYSSSWHAPSGSDHVLVDGLVNGWLTSRADTVRIIYSGDAFIDIGIAVSVLVCWYCWALCS